MNTTPEASQTTAPDSDAPPDVYIPPLLGLSLAVPVVAVCAWFVVTLWAARVRRIRAHAEQEAADPPT